MKRFTHTKQGVTELDCFALKTTFSWKVRVRDFTATD